MAIVGISNYVKTELENWRGNKERIGFVIARRDSSRLIIALLPILTGTGDSISVSETHDKATEFMERVNGLKDYTILPAHSHPIEGLSPIDYETARGMAEAGLPDIIVVEPRRIASYRTIGNKTIENETYLLKDEDVEKQFPNWQSDIEELLEK